MANRLFIFLSVVLEVPIRVLGFLSGLVKPAYRFEAERRLRGTVYGVVFGEKNVSIDREVLFEGAEFALGSGTKLYRGVQVVTGSGGSFVLGSGSHVARNTIISALGGVEIGSGCSISSCVRIYTITNRPGGEVLKSAVTIGDGVLIGSGAYIGPGVNIASNATVGSGAVVTKDVEEGAVVVGVPARSIGS